VTFRVIQTDDLNLCRLPRSASPTTQNWPCRNSPSGHCAFAASGV